MISEHLRFVGKEREREYSGRNVGLFVGRGMGEKRDTKRVEGVEHTPTWHRVGLFGRIMYGKHKSQSVGLSPELHETLCRR